MPWPSRPSASASRTLTRPGHLPGCSHGWDLPLPCCCRRSRRGQLALQGDGRGRACRQPRRQARRRRARERRHSRQRCPPRPRAPCSPPRRRRRVTGASSTARARRSPPARPRSSSASPRAAARGQGRREALALRHRGTSSSIAPRSRTCPRARSSTSSSATRAIASCGAARARPSACTPRCGPASFVELAERKAFEEAVWQLARPLNKANVRVLALEPGGPPRLASAPRIDPATKRAMVDAIDPASLPAALGLGARADRAGHRPRRRPPALRAALERHRAQPPAARSLQGGRGGRRQSRRAARRLHAAPAGRTQLAVAEGGGEGARAGDAACRASPISSTRWRRQRRACWSGQPGGPAHGARHQAGGRFPGRAAAEPGRRPVLRHRLRHHGPRHHRRPAGQHAQRRAADRSSTSASSPASPPTSRSATWCWSCSGCSACRSRGPGGGACGRRRPRASTPAAPATWPRASCAAACSCCCSCR